MFEAKMKLKKNNFRSMFLYLNFFEEGQQHKFVGGKKFNVIVYYILYSVLRKWSLAVRYTDK